ncbi:MAG: DUF4339 domain-containing protein [Comamonas sp.]|nr:DUF4339 domain-containing protein [Comamonas sp.]
MTDIDTTLNSDNSQKKEIQINVRPTLFIGVGGTGMEVLMRVRRKILNNLWGSSQQQVRIDSLAEFPIAQFIQLDLDSGALIDSSRSQSEDLQFDQVKFSEEDKIIESFDMEKYSRDEDSLEKYPHIKEWLPLTPRVIANLGIDPSKGAGQIRAISRLYFYDKYSKIRDKLRTKLKTLKSGLSHEKQLAKLGLKMELQKFRIVVIGSIAGGTGSGSFLDMGWLARAIANAEVASADVDLMLFLPTGYSGANKIRTEANGYAALMELEAAMRGNKEFISQWDSYDNLVLDREPYKEVFLIDSGNLAQQHTKDIKDVYQMVANTLFEDFSSGDFARSKRSVAVNQAQHKNYPHVALVPQQRFKAMKLQYSKRYSAFGQSVLDTQLQAKQEARSHQWAGAMLQAFFGVGASDGQSNRANDKQRDEFMATSMALSPITFSDFPEFSDTSIELKRSNGEFTDYDVVDYLLQDKQGSLLSGVEERVNNRINDIRTGFDRKEWATQVRDAIKLLHRDAVRDQDSSADTTEDRVTRRRKELLTRMQEEVRTKLYAYLDNKDYGGLEYVLSLVEQIKDRLEAPGTGLLSSLRLNSERYQEIRDAVRSREVERLLENLEQTKGGLFGSGEKQAALIMDQLRVEIANSLKFHLRTKAAEEALALMAALSAWLGQRSGVDAQGQAVWTGLVGEFQAGRNAVLQMLQQLQRSGEIIQKDLKAEHATLITVQAEEFAPAMPAAQELRAWADKAFADLGGSKVLFPMLGDAEQRQNIQRKVLRMAHAQMAARSSSPDASTDGGSDPLIAALEALPAATRADIFSKLLHCAMPWVDANLSGDVGIRSDQYKCFIGVAHSQEFIRKFSAEIQACVPTYVGLTGPQVSIIESGLPGRAVCYCELSGVPLTALRGIEEWRTSYRKEADKSPTHTHIDFSQFTHPIAPTPEELNALADDFKIYLQAVMLGIVERMKGRSSPPGQYRFEVAAGEWMRIGNERLMRINGLPIIYRQAIQDQVQERISQASKEELLALYALASYYETRVYTPKKIQNARAYEEKHQGFASAIAEELKNEFQNRLRRMGVAEAAFTATEKSLQSALPQWAQVIEYSDADAYPWEVQQPEVEEGEGPRLKYRLGTIAQVQALLQPSAGMQPTQPQAYAAPIAAAPAAPAVHASPPPQPSTALPPMPGAGAGAVPPAPSYQYHIGVQGQTYGPFGIAQLRQMLAEGRIDPTTIAWREGWPSWLSLQQSPELQPLLGNATATAALPPMPPLH